MHSRMRVEPSDNFVCTRRDPFMPSARIGYDPRFFTLVIDLIFLALFPAKNEGVEPIDAMGTLRESRM